MRYEQKIKYENMKALLINLVLGYLSWLILILIIMTIVKLIKKGKLKTINFKMALIISCIGLISPAINFAQGEYKFSTKMQPSELDQAIFKQIIQSCLSGQKITLGTHQQFWSLIDKYPTSNVDITEMISLSGNPDILLLQKYFYQDALKTIKTGIISESNERLNLEAKLLNNDQKQRNKDYLQKIYEKKPMPINGENIVLDEEICQSVLENLDYILQVANENFKLLKNKDSFK